MNATIYDVEWNHRSIKVALRNEYVYVDVRSGSITTFHAQYSGDARIFVTPTEETFVVDGRM